MPESILTTPANISASGPTADPVDAEAIRGTSRIIDRNLVEEMLPADDLFGAPKRQGVGEVGALDALGSGFAQFGIVTGGAKFVASMFDEDVSDVVDPDMNLPSYIKETPGYKEVVDAALQKSVNDDDWKALIDELEGAGNAQRVDQVVAQMQRYAVHQEVSKEAGMGWWLLGAAGGLSLDLLAGAVIGGPFAPMATVATTTTKGARAAAAIRTAEWGAVEGFFEPIAQGLTKPSLSVEDIAISTGASAIFGGILGAAAPKFFGQVVSAEAVEQAVRKEADHLGQEGLIAEGNLSAARVNDEKAFDSTVSSPDLKAPTATRGTGSLIADKILVGPLKHLRTPKRLLADVIKRATADRMKGYEGNDRLSAVLSRMYKVSTQTAEDQAGLARDETMQEGLEMMQTRLTIHEFKVKNFYDEFVAKAFGNSSVRRRVLNNDLTGDIVRKVGETMPSQAEMRNAADLFAQARGEADSASMQAAIDKLKDRVPAEMLDEYEAAIKKMADHDDDWFYKFGEAEAELGFIDAEELAPGYRPQNWNSEAVSAYRNEFTDLVEDLIAKDPDMDWVEEILGSMTKRVDDEGNELGPDLTVNPGEEWAEFSERIKATEPGLLIDLIENWDEVKRMRAVDRLLDVETQLQDELASYLDESVDDIIAGSLRYRAKLQKDIVNAEKRLNSVKEDISLPSTRALGRPDAYSQAMKLDKIATQIGALERRMADEASMANRINTLRARQRKLQVEETGQAPGASASTRTQIQELQENMRALAATTRKAKGEVKEANLRLSAVQKKLATAAGRQRLSDAAIGVTQAIAKDRNPGGFHVDDAIQTSKHFKRRQLRLKGVRHTKDWQKFLNTDSALNMEMYTQAVGRQLEMRRKYLPFLEAEGLVKKGEQPDVFMGLATYIQQGFQADVRKAREALSGDELAKELKRLEDETREGTTFLEKAFGEFTRSDYLKHANNSWDRVISIAQSASTASMLGKVLLTSLADTAIVAFAGSKFGTGFLDMFRGIRNAGVLKAIEQDDEVLAMVLRGERVMSNSIMSSRFDMDAASLNVPGGMLAKVQRMSNSLAQVSMWTNVLQPWNRFVRSAFGVGFMRQISKDLADFDSLPKDIQGFYAKHGIGAKEAKRMTTLYKKHSKSVNGIEIPNLSKWSETGDDDLVERFYRAVNGAGNEALLDPGLGDRPFLRSSPIGRLVLQFQSFTFAAAERWFAPMVQQGLMRPTDARFLMTGIIGLAMGALGVTAREWLRGEEPKLSKALDGDGQAAWDVFKEAMIRSPYAIGITGMAVDNIGTRFANPANKAFQALTGTEGELMSEEHLKFRQGQGFYSALGPAVGMAFGTVPKFISNMTDGDTDAMAETLEARVPLYNALPFVLMRKLSDDFTGD